MVSINDNYLENTQAFSDAGIVVPTYDQQVIKKLTDSSPTWIHFGGGNIFRCLHASINQQLLNQGASKTGIIVAETYDDEVISKIYHKYNNRTLSVVTKSDGHFDKELIASITNSYFFNPGNKEDWDSVINIFTNASLQLASFTITEKGYNLTDVNGHLTPQVQQDIADGPSQPKNTMSQITFLLWKRFLSGAYPIAMLSTDNFSQNGDKFKSSVMTIADGWYKKGTVDGSFLDYLQDPQKVSFPLSMIDRITPNPSARIASALKESGFEDTDIIHTEKHTNIAPFVNTEEINYLVIEDNFPNGRPALERGGVYMVDRDTVNKTDEMKVCTCLNPLHTALAINGCLLGYSSISEEMKDQDLVDLIKHIGYSEGLPVVANPKIINPKHFIDEVIDKRLPNPFTPDTPQRIVTDTSQKLAIRFGNTIRSYDLNPDLDAKNLTFIPVVIATWCRYLLGVDDQGHSMELRPDPLLNNLKGYFEGIKLGDPINSHSVLHPLLSNKSIFGIDLYSVGLGEKIENYFHQLISGKNAVRTTIHALLQKNDKNEG